MFYFLALLTHQATALRLFKYLTFRSGGAVITALLVAFVMGPRLIAWLKVRQGKGQPIRTEGPQRHVVEKQGTPTMGGLLILIPTVVATLLWADLTDAYVWIILLVTFSYGLLGFIDDFYKVTRRSSDGLSGRLRLAVEFGVGFLVTAAVMQLEGPPLAGTLAVPFFKTLLIPFGVFFILIGGTGSVVRFLADGVVAGQPRKMVVLANRNGFYYALDRVTGKFIAGRPYGNRLFVNDGKGVYLTTDRDYGDIELYVDWLMVSHNGDSGVYLRGYPQVQIWDPDNPREVKNGAPRGSGALWNNNNDNPGKWPLVKAANPIGPWNHSRRPWIRAKGER